MNPSKRSSTTGFERGVCAGFSRIKTNLANVLDVESKSKKDDSKFANGVSAANNKLASSKDSASKKASNKTKQKGGKGEDGDDDGDDDDDDDDDDDPGDKESEVPDEGADEDDNVEYLIKWQGRSHIHNSWHTQKELENGKYGGIRRLQKVREDSRERGHVSAICKPRGSRGNEHPRRRWRASWRPRGPKSNGLWTCARGIVAGTMMKAMTIMKIRRKRCTLSSGRGFSIQKLLGKRNQVRMEKRKRERETLFADD